MNPQREGNIAFQCRRTYKKQKKPFRASLSKTATQQKKIGFNPSK
jgi:hypothetical protein